MLHYVLFYHCGFSCVSVMANNVEPLVILVFPRYKTKQNKTHTQPSSNDRGLLIRNHGGQREAAPVSSTERKEPSTLNSMIDENTLQK